MANTAALLGNLLMTNADINYYTQQQIFWSNKYEANTAKLQKQVNYEEKWETAFDECMDADTEKPKKINGKTYTPGSEAIAKQYADAKVKEYNEELSLELADLDIEYDTMKCMYDTLLEEMRAQKDADKTATSNAAQDTGLLQS